MYPNIDIFRVAYNVDNLQDVDIYKSTKYNLIIVSTVYWCYRNLNNKLS